MKRSLYIVFCLLVLTVISCKHDDDEVPSRTIFEFTARDWSTEEDWWVALYDNESGDFIDSKQVFPNAKTTFESTKKIPSNKLTVSFLRGSTRSIGRNIGDIFSDIDIGAKWSFGYPVINVIQPVQHTIGSFDLEITNVPSLFSFSMSAGSSETSFANNLTYEDEIISTIANATEETQLLYLDTGDGNPKYLELENTQDEESVSIDYADFQDLDKYVKVSFPQPIGVSSVYFTTNYAHPLTPYYAYTLANYNYQPGAGAKSELNFGFLNKFSKYYIYLFAGSWVYTSSGAAPTAIQYVSTAGYSTTGTKAEDFKVTTTNDYIYSISSFGYESGDDYLNIDYHFAKGKEKIFDVVHGDFADKYKVNKDIIEYRNTTFAVTGRSYVDAIRYLYDDTYDLNTTWTEGLVFGTH